MSKSSPVDISKDESKDDSKDESKKSKSETDDETLVWLKRKNEKGIFTGVTLWCGDVELKLDAHDIRTNWQSEEKMEKEKIPGLWCASENQKKLRVLVSKTQGITESQDGNGNKIPKYIDLQRNTVLLTALRMALIIKISNEEHIILSSTYEKTTPVKLGSYTTVGHGGYGGTRDNSVAGNLQHDESSFITNLKVIDWNYGWQFGQMLNIDYANIYEWFADELETRKGNLYTKGTQSDFEWNIWYFLNQIKNAVTIQNTKYKLQFDDKAKYNKKLCDQIMQLTLDYFKGIDKNPVINTDEMLTPGTLTPSNNTSKSDGTTKRNSGMQTPDNMTTDEMLTPGMSTPSKKTSKSDGTTNGNSAMQTPVNMTTETATRRVATNSSKDKRKVSEIETVLNQRYEKFEDINRQLDGRLLTLSKRQRIGQDTPQQNPTVTTGDKSPGGKSSGGEEPIVSSPSSSPSKLRLRF